MAFFVIWTTQHLGISATKTGLLYSVNAFIALLMQPFFGFISDKFGLKKRLIWILVAMLLPVGMINEETAAGVIPGKDATVLVYCRSGNRSKTASSALADLGYTNIYEFGGINTWPYETES